MKKHNLFKMFKAFTLVIGGVVLISSAVLINGCKKETPIKTNANANIDNLKTSSVMTAEDSLFSKKMVWFDGIMENYKTIPNYTLNKQFSSDSAIYYLEAWFNAKYAFPDESYINVIHKDTTLSISLTKELINMDGINSNVASLKSKIESKYNDVTFSKKALMLVHFEKSSTSSQNQLNFKIQMTFGELGFKERSENPFGDDDAWKYGDEAGKCHDPNFVGQDAGELIQNEINTQRTNILVSPPPGYVFSYIPDDDIIVKGFEFDNPDDDTLDNDLDMLIFYRTSEIANLNPLTPDGQCLEPYTMNFHYFGEWDVINNKLPERENKPSNWTFMTCDLLGEQYSDGIYVIIHHKNTLTYAFRYLVREDWIQEEELYCTK